MSRSLAAVPEPDSRSLKTLPKERNLGLGRILWLSPHCWFNVHSRCPSEYSVPLLDAVRVAAAASSSPELAARSEFVPQKYRPYGFGRSRLAVSHFLGYAVFLLRARRPQLSEADKNLSSSFALRGSISQRTLADRPLAGRLLSWASFPFSACGAGRSTSRGHAGPLRSAFRVCLPS
jgi:hypothetical protein